MAALSETSSGSRCIAIVGEPGIGKSRLVREAMKLADGRGARAVIGVSLDLESGGAPLGPIREALTQLNIASEVFSPGTHDVAPSPGERQRLFDDVRRCLEEASSDRPLLIVIEDVQWSDHSTRDLLAHLIGQPAVTALFLLTVRIEHVSISDEVGSFLAHLEQRGVGERIEVGPLSGDEVAAQVREILRREPDRELLDPILRRAEGNPFFVEELLAVAVAGRGGVLPPTVADAILARIADLGAEVDGVLRLAAVGGRRVPHRLLERVSSIPGPQLETLLRPAIRRRILSAEPGTADDSYVFRHALVPEALYRDLLPSERARLHARYAAALADDAPFFDDPMLTAVERAHHLERAHDLLGARRAWIEAAETAYRMLAFPEADAHFARALAIPDPNHGRAAQVDLLERASQAARAAGRSQRAVTLLRDSIAALGSRALERRVFLWQQLSSSLWEGGEVAEAARAAEECVRLAEPLPASPAKARASSSLASVDLVLGFLDRARARSAAACEIARESRSSFELAFALSIHGLTRAALGEGEAGVADLRVAWDAGRESDSLELQGSAAMNYLETVDIAYGAAVTIPLGHELLADARRRGMADLVFGLLAAMGSLQYRVGLWDAARASYDEASTGLFTQQWVGWLASERSILLASLGELTEARELVGQAEEVVGGSRELPFTLGVHRAIAHLALCEDDPARAQAAVEQGWATALPGARDPVHGPPLLLLGLRAVADIIESAHARRTAKAGATIGALRRSAERFGRTLLDLVSEREANPDRRCWRALGEAELARALGRDTAEEWERVIDRAAAADLVPGRAYGLLRHAAVSLRHPLGRPDAASAMADAHAIAGRLGAVPLQQRVESLARRARVHLPSMPVREGAVGASEVDQLSPRELEVLGLIASGYSNRQIAESLFITEKTAGAHVSSILSKLQVANRGEAAVTALKSGILGS
jgi:predicted ATPase/DNA-binding CsgD family transcriptional regulator